MRDSGATSMRAQEAGVAPSAWTIAARITAACVTATRWPRSLHPLVEPVRHPVHHLANRLAAMRSGRGIGDPGGQRVGLLPVDVGQGPAAPAAIVAVAKCRGDGRGQAQRERRSQRRVFRARPGCVGARRPRGRRDALCQRRVVRKAWRPAGAGVADQHESHRGRRASPRLPAVDRYHLAGVNPGCNAVRGSRCKSGTVAPL